MRKKVARHPRLFKNFRWKRAMHYIDEADECEIAYNAAATLGLDNVADSHARRAMEAYLKAIKWWPLTSPQMIPSPRPEPPREYYELIPCVQCARLIPMGQLYCFVCGSTS